MKSVALALGGGGARGLAHIAVFETLDEMGIRPAAIAGIRNAYPSRIRTRGQMRAVVHSRREASSISRSRDDSAIAEGKCHGRVRHPRAANGRQCG